MKPLQASLLCLSLCLAARLSCVAEERASLNAQEYDCRENIKECLSLNDGDRFDCYLSQSLADSCISSPLHKLLVLRADAESELSDRECLKKLDSELSGLLTKDTYALQEIRSLEQKIALCRKSTSDEIMKP